MLSKSKAGHRGNGTSLSAFWPDTRREGRGKVTSHLVSIASGLKQKRGDGRYAVCLISPGSGSLVTSTHRDVRAGCNAGREDRQVSGLVGCHQCCPITSRGMIHRAPANPARLAVAVRPHDDECRSDYPSRTPRLHRHTSLWFECRVSTSFPSTCLSSLTTKLFVASSLLPHLPERASTALVAPVAVLSSMTSQAMRTDAKATLVAHVPIPGLRQLLSAVLTRNHVVAHRKPLLWACAHGRSVNVAGDAQ